jgi:CRISPR-associated protein Cst2
MSTQEFLPMQKAQDQQGQVAQQVQQDTGVFEIAILARGKWNLHSLNNEGTIGNVTEPRTVVLWDGTRSDGVSGEMMKHIHAYWTWLQVKTGNLPLCPACQSFQPQRADAAPQGLNLNDNAQAMHTAIKRCVLCDLHGFLVQRPTIHRQSVVEFGWIVGVPEKFYRDIHAHARHAVAERGVQEEERAETEEEAHEAERTEVAAQMVYHRPTRSGVYALVTLFQPWRIGLNEVNYTYALDPSEQASRYRFALTAYEWTLKRPDGAMTTTRFPHIQGIEGIVLFSRKAVPVPMLSPLRDDYREKLESLAKKQGVEVRKFDDLDQLVDILIELHKEAPLRMPFPEMPGEPAATGGVTRRRGRRRREEEAPEVLEEGEQSDLEASQEEAQEPEPDQE